jgi:hypothetical protein
VIQAPDVGLAVVEVGYWVTAGRAILQRDAWSRMDAYTTWVAAPATAGLLAWAGLWLASGTWALWAILMFAKRGRRVASPEGQATLGSPNQRGEKGCQQVPNSRRYHTSAGWSGYSYRCLTHGGFGWVGEACNKADGAA